MESLSFPKFQLLSGWCVFDSAGGTSPKPWRRKRPLSSWKSSLESSPQWHGKWPAPPMSFGFNDFFGFPLEAEKTSGISIYKTSFLWIIVDDAILNLLIWAMAMLPRNTESFFDKCLSFRVFIWFPTDSLSPELLMHFRENFQNFPSNLCGKLLGFVQLSTLWKRFFSSTWDQVFLATKKNQKVDFEIASLWCWSLVANFFCVSPSHQISLNKWQIPPSVPQESHLVPSPQKKWVGSIWEFRVSKDHLRPLPIHCQWHSLPCTLGLVLVLQGTQNRKIAPNWWERCFFAETDEDV